MAEKQDRNNDNNEQQQQTMSSEPNSVALTQPPLHHTDEEGGKHSSDINQSQPGLSGQDYASATNHGRQVIHDFFYPHRQQPQQKQQPPFVEKDDAILPSSPKLGMTTADPSLSSRLEDGPNGHDRARLGPNNRIIEDSTRPRRRKAPTPTLDVPATVDGSHQQQPSQSHQEMGNVDGTVGNALPLPVEGDSAYRTQEQQDKKFVEQFWTGYDEILILSLFTQIGILCRLGAAYWFRYFDGVFHADSALFTNLPLNCLSCFVMGMLCSGESLMEIINTRFTPPRLQQDLHREAQISHRAQLAQFMEDSDDEDLEEMETAGTTRRRKKRGRQPRRRNRTKTVLQSQQNQSVLQELREVQLLAWERRIRASKCLLLFPVKQEDVDVVEDYFSDGYRRESPRVNSNVQEGRQGQNFEMTEEWTDEIADESLTGFADEGDFDDLILEEEDNNGHDSEPGDDSILSTSSGTLAPPVGPSNRQSRNIAHPIVAHSAMDNNNNADATATVGRMHAAGVPHIRARQYARVEGGNVIDYGTHDNPDLDQMITTVATGVSKNISRMRRVNLANGWDVGTSPEEKSADLMLGLRDGLCGALSSFSSWISSMVHLFRTAQIGQAFVGLMLGIQLPLIAYRFGQYVSVYIFVWRCRREKRRDERRGYGIQLHMDDEGPGIQPSNPGEDISESATNQIGRTKGRRTVHDEDSEVPSVRAIITALFITSLVAQLTSLNFFYEPEDRLLALSMLFSPLGVLARWRMMKFNSWRPSFPIGTFACNVTACALAGTLGTVLAGNPGPTERIVLVSIIAGFGGTLSSVARFLVEIIAGLDPILFRLDGLYYAITSVFCGLMVSLVFSASVDWADRTDSSSTTP